MSTPPAEYPKYWKGAYNRTMGLPVMRQLSAQANSHTFAMVMLDEKRSQIIADAIIAAMESYQ